MAKANRVCKACGKEYYFCPTCDTNKPSWYKIYDSEACKDTYKAIADYNFGHIDANQANEILKSTNVKIVDEDLKKIVYDIKAKANVKKVKKNEEEHNCEGKLKW